MATRPSVTAVVPTHNRPELMQRAVQSIVDQDYDGDIEVIVVFDACDVFTPQVRLPERRTLRTLTNERTRGLAGARNSGIMAATHEFVAFLDDDDYWLPGKLSAQLDRFEAAPMSVLVGTAMVLDDGVRTYDRLVPVDLVRHSDLIRDRLAGLHSSTFLFRTAQLIGLGMVDEKLPGSYGEDYDLLLRAAKVAPIPVVNRPLVSVSWSRDSYFFGKWGAYAEGLTYLLQTHAEFQGDRKSHGRLAGQIAFARAANGDRTEARDWFRRAVRNDPTQVKAWLALAISLRLLSAAWVARTVQRLGRGI